MSEEALSVIPLNVFREIAAGFQSCGLFAEKAAWLREAFRCFSDPPAGPPHHGGGGGDRHGDRGGGRGHGRREYREHGSHDRGGNGGGGNGGGGGRYRYGDGPRDRGPPNGLRRPVGLGHAAGIASAPAEKPRIGNRELSLENLARKDFLGVLNKLSAANQATLIANFAKVIRPDFADLYVKLFWEGFLRSADYQPVQINLLTLFAEHFPVQPHINALLSAYRSERLWMPAEGVLPPPAAAADAEPASRGDAAAEYDDFCDYVKWRKRTVNTIHAWRVLAGSGWVAPDVLQEMLSEVLADFRASLATFPETVKLAETLAEQMFVYAKSIGSAGALRPETLAELRALPAASFPPALRFKIYDLRDFLRV
jgi:hypothetical protein